MEAVIITGMSGAGKTVAAQSFEDLGYYVIDNLPPKLIPNFLEVVSQSENLDKVALVIDLRSKEFFHELFSVFHDVSFPEFINLKILFLKAKDEVLVARYKESRRNHPLSTNGRLIDGINEEREALQPLEEKADYLIDTSELSSRKLREKIIEIFNVQNKMNFHVECLSFGFKYGVPIDADIVMDVRFLPNPYYIPELKYKTGMDQDVYDYVMSHPETDEFYERFMNLIEYLLPAYKEEGKRSVTVAIGCTGGKHRSVSLVRRISKQIEKWDYPVSITHRDKEK